MGIKVKARQTKLAIGPSAGQYRFIMIADIYSTLKPEKVISEASLRSGIAKGTITATWEAIGDVIKNWATEGHSVPIPGLGTMRFGVRATAVENVDDVSTSLITSRRVIFTPSTDIKQELKDTSINITQASQLRRRRQRGRRARRLYRHRPGRQRRRGRRRPPAGVNSQ